MSDANDFFKMKVLVVDKNNIKHRRVKYMFASAQAIEIVDKQFVSDSIKARKFLPTTPYLITALVTESSGFSFSTQKTLENGTAAQRDGGLFFGNKLYLCPNVAKKNGCPPREGFALLFKASGGKELSKVAFKKVSNHSNTIIITSPVEKVDQTAGVVGDALKHGATKLTSTQFFNAVLAQEHPSPSLEPNVTAEASCKWIGGSDE